MQNLESRIQNPESGIKNKAKQSSSNPQKSKEKSSIKNGLKALDKRIPGISMSMFMQLLSFLVKIMVEVAEFMP